MTKCIKLEVYKENSHLLKRLFLIFNLLILQTALYSADLRFIHLSTINDIDSVEQDLLFVINNQSILQGFIPDEYWQSGHTREECITVLERLYTGLSAIEDPENQEYLLLKAVLSEYLYHLNATDYYRETVDNYLAVEDLSQRDYRCKWFLGLFYAKSAHPFEAIPQFEYVLDKVPHDKIHPEFFQDYGYAQLLALMPESARTAYDDYFTRIGGDPSSFSLYRNLEDQLVTYESGDLDSSELYRYLERMDSKGLQCRLTGTYIPVPEGWEFSTYGLKNQCAVIQLSSPDITSSSGMEISFSLLVISYLADGITDEKLLARFPDLKEIKLGSGKEMQSFEFSDPETYKHMGGSRGIVSIIDREYSPRSGRALEEPARLVKEPGNGMTYLPLQKEYTRYNGTIKHMVLLDTCSSIYDESRAVLEDFLARTKFE